MAKKKHIGSTLENFLREEGRLEEARATALKRVLAWQLAEAMNRQKITKVELARRMKTSRAQVNRILDPTNDRVTFHSVVRAAVAINRRMTLRIA